MSMRSVGQRWIIPLASGRCHDGASRLRSSTNEDVQQFQRSKSISRKTHSEGIFCDVIKNISSLLNKEVRTGNGGWDPPYRDVVAQFEVGIMTGG